MEEKTVIAKNLILSSWHEQDFDHLALAYFNLQNDEVSFLEVHEGEVKSIPHFYFDLASLTKPLTLGALYASSPELFSKEWIRLLEHRAGLPRWAILGRKSWQQSLDQFEIGKGEVNYSDLSFLKLMVEIERKTGKSLKELTDFFWDSELCFWKDLPEVAFCPETGYRQGEAIQGEVNDDNCYKLDRFCSHAGLFSTLKGLYQTLHNLEKKTGLLRKMEEAFDEKRENRFLYGWDTVEDPSHTLAGQGCSPYTFGHLGFTGTSIWIDAKSGQGWILLTNSTKKYWFHRDQLNNLRRSLGQLCWN